MQQKLLFPFKLNEAKRSSAKITSLGGVPLVLETYRVLGLDRVVEQHLRVKQRGWTENVLLEELIALQIAGGDCMDDVDVLRADDSKMLAGYATLPSSAAVGRFLHRFDVGISEARSLGSACIPEENTLLQALAEVNRHLVRQLVERTDPAVMTVDVDATVIQSSKQLALETYKGGTGYQPMQAVWAEAQVILAEQFRDGNVNAHADALAFLKRIEKHIPTTKQDKKRKLRLRSDGAWYQHSVMEYCVQQGYEFSISADVSYGLKRFVHAIAEAEWKPLCEISNTGKEKTTKEYAELRFTSASLAQAEMRERIAQYRYLVIRTPRSQVDVLEGAYHYSAIVTNMDWQPERHIAWHYERCGSIEKVIDMLKNDLGGGTFPCGTFGANAAWWRITCLTHNLVQALKIIALPAEWLYTRMKKLRFRLFCVAGRITQHARQLFLQLARGHPILPIYREARAKLAAFAQ